MITVVTSKQNIARFVIFLSVAVLSFSAQAKSSNEPTDGTNSIDNTKSSKMVSFTVAVNNNKVDLKWVTASEVNLSHFVIQKSTDGINYSDAGVFFAYGNATEKTNYKLSDKLDNNQAAVVYYRLCLVDNSGKGQYSEATILNTAK